MAENNEEMKMNYDFYRLEMETYHRTYTIYGQKESLREMGEKLLQLYNSYCEEEWKIASLHELSEEYDIFLCPLKFGVAYDDDHYHPMELYEESNKITF